MVRRNASSLGSLIDALSNEEEMDTSSSPPLMRRRAMSLLGELEGMQRTSSSQETLSEMSQELCNTLPARRLSLHSACALADPTCAICCEDILGNQDVACMPCDGMHAYHNACVRQWILRKPACPKCRWTADETTSAALQGGVARAEAYLQSLRHSGRLSLESPTTSI